ncbi:MAG: cob(I)yrinic acid a,c-diamide adenosyltransferase [Myxococcota bacterium]|nr:cob(I)yrinic acid a,c-diamide adenosyltransferase [Myxococcota bacterium]
MKVYTRRGDKGETDLAGGGRVSKDALRVEAYGAVDELNAALGLVVVDASPDLMPALERIQRQLFEIGAVLATSPESRSSVLASTGVSDDDVDILEQTIDEAEKDLPPLQNFILPGGCPAAAALHMARTVCRRAERRVVALDREEPIAGPTLRYLNRLSDLMFTWARWENARSGSGDVEWNRSES